MGRASDGQSILRNVAGDARRRADVGSFTYAHGRDESRITSDEGTVFDHGCVLVSAIVVASDGSGADVHACANFRVAEIGKVVGLRSLAQLDLFRLHEITDVCIFSDIAAGAQMRIRSKDGVGADAGVFENAAVAEENSIGRVRNPESRYRSECGNQRRCANWPKI